MAIQRYTLFSVLAILSVNTWHKHVLTHKNIINTETQKHDKYKKWQMLNNGRHFSWWRPQCGQKASSIYLRSSSSFCSSNVYRQQSGWCRNLYSILTHFLAFNLSRFSFYINIYTINWSVTHIYKNNTYRMLHKIKWLQSKVTPTCSFQETS